MRGHFTKQTQDLAPRQRQQCKTESEKDTDEYQVGDGHAKPVGQADTLQLLREALGQEGEHNGGQHGRQNIAYGRQQHHGDGQQHQ